MIIRKTALGTLVAMAVVSVPAVALAATPSATTTATANISAGSLTLTAPTVATAFPTITLNGQVQSAQATLSNWTVTDATGSGNGWHVTLSGTQFTEVAPSAGFASGSTALTLPDGSLQLSGARSVTAGTGATVVSATYGPLMENPQNVIDGQSAFTLIDAQPQYGMGAYTVNEPQNGLTLTLDPGTTKVDPTNYAGQSTPYSSTLTYSVVSGP